jgi:hypothetical protein
MKRFLSVLILILCGMQMLSALDVKITGDPIDYKLNETEINGIPYVAMADVHTLFKSICKQDRGDQRLYLHLYGETFIFLEGSSFWGAVLFAGDLYA